VASSSFGFNGPWSLPVEPPASKSLFLFHFAEEKKFPIRKDTLLEIRYFAGMREGSSE
jgi:hypothetical protein